VQPATLLAGAVVGLAAIYLLVFGMFAVAAPSRITVYLHGFASSAGLHATELIVRLVVGIAFVGYASQMQFDALFRAFGWILVITTIGLAALPWRWHERFARAAVPAAIRYHPLIGIAAIAAGAFVIWALAGAVFR